MTPKMIDESQRKTARVAGFTFLFAIVVVVLANYGTGFWLLFKGLRPVDFAGTASDRVA